MSQNNDMEILQLIQKKCFKCKNKEHMVYNYSKKAKFFTILGTSDINDNKKINKEKK